MSNEKKDKQLGMPLGTATHKLRKKILFNLIVQTKQDLCYRCKKKIQNESTLSIEHKIPWLDNSVDLFWDLDNIAFSHLSCNVRENGAKWQKGHVHKNPPANKKVGPKGTAWCRIHKEFLPVVSFSVDRESANGLANLCKVCRSNLRSSRQS